MEQLFFLSTIGQLQNMRCLTYIPSIQCLESAIQFRIHKPGLELSPFYHLSITLTKVHFKSLPVSISYSRIEFKTSVLSGMYMSIPEQSVPMTTFSCLGPILHLRLPLYPYNQVTRTLKFLPIPTSFNHHQKVEFSCCSAVFVLFCFVVGEV